MKQTYIFFIAFDSFMTKILTSFLKNSYTNYILMDEAEEIGIFQDDLYDTEHHHVMTGRISIVLVF